MAQGHELMEKHEASSRKVFSFTLYYKARDKVVKAGKEQRLLLSHNQESLQTSYKRVSSRKKARANQMMMLSELLLQSLFFHCGLLLQQMEGNAV